MFSHSNKWAWILVLLVVSNIGYYLYQNWGLVTVKVTNAPLGKVISSIEWQAWVKIYTNLPLDTKVTMFADHVPLAEAMETLAVNVDVPPPTEADDGAPRRDRRRQGGFAGMFGGAPPAPGAAPTAGPPGGSAPGGSGGGGGRGGGFGRAAQWNLAFFVAPTSMGVKQEIRAFQAGDTNDDTKVYTYGTQMQFISSDSMTTAPDPRLQAWPGYQPPAPTVTSADPPASASSSAGTDPATPPAAPVPIFQSYLQAFAQSANIWIMAPATWAPDVSAPPPNSSIIHALTSLVSSSRGAVTEALILRAGRGGPRPTGTGDDGWADRMRNAINGLPPSERADAVDQLNKEIQFRKELQALPPDQRRQRMIQHFADRMIYGERLSRLSPVKRAQIFARMVAMRAAAKAAK